MIKEKSFQPSNWSNLNLLKKFLFKRKEAKVKASIKKSKALKQLKKPCHNKKY